MIFDMHADFAQQGIITGNESLEIFRIELRGAVGPVKFVFKTEIIGFAFSYS